MNDSNGLDGIQSGDHKMTREIRREAQNGCMAVMLVVIGIFVTGMVTGWALTMAFGK